MPWDIIRTHAGSVFVPHTVDRAERLGIVKVDEHERADLQADSVIIPAFVNPVLSISSGFIEQGHWSPRLFPGQVGSSFDGSGAHGCAAEAAPHASP